MSAAMHVDEEDRVYSKVFESSGRKKPLLRINPRELAASVRTLVQLLKASDIERIIRDTL